MTEILAAPSAQEVRPMLVGSSIPVLTYATPEGAPFDFNFEHVDPDYKSRLDPEVLLAMAKAALKR